MKMEALTTDWLTTFLAVSRARNYYLSGQVEAQTIKSMK